MFIPEGSEHSDSGVVGESEGGVGVVMGVSGDEGADVGDGGEVGEEAAVGAGHVGAHFVDEVVF